MQRTCFLFFLIIYATLFPVVSQPVKIGVITDVHFLSEQLVDDGKAYQSYQNATGRNVKDLHAVLELVLSDLHAEEIDVLLISGDLTNHGERQSHLDFIEKLKPLQQNGTRIFVTPGNHDVQIPDSKKYIGDKAQSVPSISPQDFADLYAPLGASSMLKKDTASLSYLAELNDKTWLLSIDANRYKEYTTTSLTGGRILASTLNWMLEILAEAKKKGIVVLGMMHHGLVEHMPYQSTFFANYLIDDWQKNAAILADAGLKVVFTGHFHSTDVSAFTSSPGNTIYDVETGSLAQYPFAYRLMELNDDTLNIDTRFVSSLPGNGDFIEKYRNQLETITRRVAKNRIGNLGIPLPSATREALVELIVKMNLMHVKGDEVLDEETERILNHFAELLEGEEFDSNFSLDYPPADNTLTINLR